MKNNPAEKLFSTFLFLTIFFFSATVSFAEEFSNPLLSKIENGCAEDNLRAERFAVEINFGERVKLCRAIDKITNKLNATAWSPALDDELKNLWKVFTDESVTFRMMREDAPSRTLAMAEAFPSESSDTKFNACIYVRPEKSDNESFFQILLHELRHVADFHETWKNKTAIESLELERRAFLLMSKITEETPEKEKLSGVPKFWKEKWRKRSAEEIAAKRTAAIEKYLRGNKYYRNLSQGDNKQALDFSYLKDTAKIKETESKNNEKTIDRLPDRPLLPQIVSSLPQNISESNFDLEKPKNPRDAAEILRVAIANEKRLYYGMNNFVYDQKLAFQCWHKGKISAEFAENNTIARTGSGGVLFQNASYKSAASPCALDSKNLKTDFTETFWASPALEKMPIRFVGFVEDAGKTLARYTVYQPDARLFAELESAFPNIKPFRVFVGTIFVAPEDGQIVKFWGTSFPEETVTGKNQQKVWGSYSVTALRQKLNIDAGLWVTVFVGTSAVANVSGNSRPFSYTVKFENYRQSTSDVKILDDEETQGTLIR